MGKRSAYLALVMAFALVLAACSSDDGATFLDQSSETAADSSSDASADSDALADGEVPDIDDLIDELPDDVGDIPGLSNECEELLNLFLSVGGVFLGGEISVNSDALAGLPGEIQGDAQFVAETLAEFSQTVQDMGIDFSDPGSLATLTEAQQQEFGALTDSLDTEQFNTAVDNLSAWGEQECESEFG